jgi:DNA-binding transcriptional LysR family regulator
VRWLLDGVAEPTVVFRSSSMVAQQNAAAAGLGLVMLPSFTGERDPRLRPVLAGIVSVKRELWLAFHEDMRGLPRVHAVTSFVTELIETDQAFLRGETG